MFVLFDLFCSVFVAFVFGFVCILSAGHTNYLYKSTLTPYNQTIFTKKMLSGS